jgi:hypothetical protein
MGSERSTAKVGLTNGCQRRWLSHLGSVIVCVFVFAHLVVTLRADCWFYPPLVASLKALMAQPEAFDGTSGPVRVHSLEVWEALERAAPGDAAPATSSTSDRSGSGGYRLVAGEVGYSVGLLYTSLSGFCDKPSAGSVQMACTAALLAARGAALWYGSLSLLCCFHPCFFFFSRCVTRFVHVFRFMIALSLALMCC